MRVTIASHNTMHGTFLEALLDHYKRLDAQLGLDVLCLQENLPLDDSPETQAHGIGRNLGPFHCVCLDECPGLATLVRSSWSVLDAFLIALPRLPRLNPLERLYIREGRATQKYALVTHLGQQAARLTIANFHLETAGNNAHRTRQVKTIASALTARGLDQPLVACGDTNAFTWSKTTSPRVLELLLEPLRRSTGASLRSALEPTHYFARQRENLLTHRLVTLLGGLGIDHPLPYDVICSNLACLESGRVPIEESDHDLVYARLTQSD